MSHMQPQVWHGAFVRVTDSFDGDRWIPESDLGAGEVSYDLRIAYGARLSAPGYLDCTEWEVFDTEQEACSYLADMAELCENCLGELNEDGACSEDCKGQGYMPNDPERNPWCSES